jgi:hypothetical protein
MKEFDALLYPCNICDVEDCEERENIIPIWRILTGMPKKIS